MPRGASRHESETIVVGGAPNAASTPYLLRREKDFILRMIAAWRSVSMQVCSNASNGDFPSPGNLQARAVGHCPLLL